MHNSIQNNKKQTTEATLDYDNRSLYSAKKQGGLILQLPSPYELKAKNLTGSSMNSK